MFHPGDRTVPIRHALASMPLVFEFRGVAAHAAGSPTEGRSALAAMIQLFVSVDALRQFVPETSRMHGVILDGGRASNVIPDYTRASFQVRTVTSEQLTDLVERVVACAEAAALATGTTVEVTRGHVYTERKNNHAIAYRVARHLTELGEEVEEPVLRGGTGSSDIGNVSLRLPAIHPYIKVMPRGTPGHSHAMTEAVASMDAHRATLRWQPRWPRPAQTYSATARCCKRPATSSPCPARTCPSSLTSPIRPSRARSVIRFS